MTNSTDSLGMTSAGQLLSNMSKKSFNLTEIKDLLLEPDEAHEWIVDEQLIKGGLSLLVGKPKAGKTTLSRYLAYCVAGGKDFLGFKTVKSEVIYLALEEKRSEVKKHFRAMGCVDEKIFVHAASAPEGALMHLANLIEEMKPGLVIIDPLFRFIRVSDLNDYAKVTTALEPLIDLVRRTGCHIMCVHHTNKGMSKNGDNILGSTAIFAAVDASLNLERSENNRFLNIIKRYGSDLENQQLNMDPLTRKVELIGSKEEFEVDSTIKKITQYLTNCTISIREQDLMEYCSVKTSTFKKALKKALEDDLIERKNSGLKGDPYEYQKVKNASSHIEINIGNDNLGEKYE